MNPRQRYIETLAFGVPDRIPFEPGGPRESTLARWHRDGLPAEANWYEAMAGELGIEVETPTRPWVDVGVDFRMIPQFEEKVLEHRDGHYVVQDWKGNICEIADTFDVTYLRLAKDFVTRRWIRCPVETRADWEAMKTRYSLDSPGRFPADFQARAAACDGRDWVLSVNFPGPFWQMREWCGFEGLCMLMIEDESLVAEMAEFWLEFVDGVLERMFRRVVPDAIFISEDMAYKIKAMISPAMVRRFCLPAWRAWSARARGAGVPIVDMDSDGFVGELIAPWIEAGITVCDPMEVAAGNDILDSRRRFGRAIAYRQGVDKRAIAAGGRVLRRELARLEPLIADGGFIPGCDHGVPADVSWGNYLEYCGQLAKMTGWL